MKAKIKRLLISLSLGLSFPLAVLTLLNVGLWLTDVQAANNVRYVAPGGTDGSNTCVNSNTPCATVQHAVDVADSGNEIRVAAGTYTGVSTRDGFTQMAYITKSVRLRGGFATTNWTTSNPIANPTILDAQQQGIVLGITGTITVVVEGLRLTGGDSCGICVVTATAIVRNNSIYSNTDGIFLWYVANETILSDNSVYSNSGNGVVLNFSPATLVGNIISNNKSGGVFLIVSKQVALNDNFIERNIRSGLNCELGGISGMACKGGGVSLYHSDATLSGNTINQNQAKWSGGGVALEYSTARLNNNTIISNTTLDIDSGGGVYLYSSSQVTLENNLIAGNEAEHGGGVSLEDNSSAILARNTISGNTARSGGGGMFLSFSDNVMLDSNVIQGNEAQVWGGGAGLLDGQATFTNTVIVDNHAESEGSGLYLENSSARLLHTTIARNSGGDESGVYVRRGSTVTLTNTILVSQAVGITATADSAANLNKVLWFDNGANTGGAGAIAITNAYTGDPAFIALKPGNYHLSPDSEALDEGVNAGVTIDIDGESRPYDGGYDLGADEGQPSLAVTKEANLSSVQAGELLTYTLQVTNTGYITLTAAITDLLPNHVIPTGIRTWTTTLPIPGGVWTEQIAVTVEEEYIGSLVNVVQATSEEGATDIYTQTLRVLYYLPVVLHED